MKTIGLLGGMSWESTQHYYSAINEGIKAQLGGLHSAELVLYSVDFAPIEQLQHAGRWDECGEVLASAARKIEAGGADCLLICTNTMHKLTSQIESVIHIPLLHIADATAAALQAANVHKVGLLGTAFTMEQDFYKGRLANKFGMDVLIPEAAQRGEVHRIIYEELCQGVIKRESKVYFQQVIAALAEQGAEGVILGCTEISLLVAPEDSHIPLFDTTEIHSQQAVAFALSDD